MKKRGIFLVFLLVMFSLTFVNSQPPFQANTLSGIILESPMIEYHKVNSSFTFHVHAHNFTDGILLTNATTNCTIHLYHPNDGSHVYESLMSFNSNGLDFEANVGANNFSELGQYAVLFYCVYPGEIGGFLEYAFTTTKTGQGFTTQDSLLYFILAFGVFLLFFLSFYFMMVTPYSNKVDTGGAVIGVSKLKYVKLALILLTWVLFTWFLNILIGLSDNYATLTMYYGFFGFMFDIMNYLALPLGIFILILAFFEIIRDADINKQISKFGSAN